MGDAYTCTKCGRSKYPEALNTWDRICLLKNGVTLAEGVTWRGSDAERKRRGRLGK